MQRLTGAYSLALLTPTHLIAVRDPMGIRPLCLGRLPGRQPVNDGSAHSANKGEPISAHSPPHPAGQWRLGDRLRVVRPHDHRRPVHPRHRAGRDRHHRRRRPHLLQRPRQRRSGTVRLRVHLLRPPRQRHRRPLPLPVPPGDGTPACTRAPRRSRHRDRRARLRHPRRHWLRRSNQASPTPRA